VPREHAATGVGHRHEGDARCFAGRDDFEVTVRTKGGVDDVDLGVDEHLDAVGEREEAVPDDDGTFDVVTGIVGHLEDSLCRSDAVDSTTTVADDLAVLHGDDGVALGVVADGCAEYQIGELLLRQRLAVDLVALGVGVNDVDAALLLDVGRAEDRDTDLLRIEHQAVDVRQQRVHCHVAGVAPALQQFDCLRRDVGSVDCSHDPLGRLGLVGGGLDDLRDLFVDLEVRDEDATEDGTIVTRDRETHDVFRVITVGTSADLAVLDGDGDVRNRAERLLEPCCRTNEGVLGTAEVGDADRAARCTSEVGVLRGRQRMVVVFCLVETGHPLMSVLRADDLDELGARRIFRQQIFCLHCHGLAPLFVVCVFSRASPT
jgi:hypothetical protein